MSGFVHLHVHTQYSLLDGAIRLQDLFNAALEYKMPAVAITDHGNMFGALEFYEKAIDMGIKPIIGCEVYVAPKSRLDRHSGSNGENDRNYHLVLLAMNETGYKNLMKLVTLAYLEGFYYKPRIDKELLGIYHNGLIALSGCLHGEVASNVVGHRLESAKKAALEYQEIMGPGNFFLELQANKMPLQDEVNKELIKIGRELGIPLVATNDCHYLRKGDARAHEILLCIQTGKTILDEKRMRFHTDQLYFKSPEEMASEFSHIPDALENTLKISERCELKLDLGKHHFPVFPLEKGETIEERFEKAVLEGFSRRIAEIRRRRPNFGDQQLTEYKKRLRYEIEVIKKMEYCAYFLIVADFIGYAKANKIPVGPGRGSAAGSLVAYAMGITELDPLEYGLIFERFLNSGRISLPDIDVDFCIHGREKVLNYVVEKYGKDRVAQIATFGTMMARAVVRDVGRSLGMSYNEVDRIAKLIPAAPGMTLKKAFELEPRLKQIQQEDPQARELFEIALSLEGLTRHVSTHAAGVVIADKPIVEYVPLYRDEHGGIVTQYSMNYVEKAGLVKFDFLGLRNLTVINNAVQLIRKNHGIEIDINNLPLDDPKTYELLCRADTTGVFQLESPGMRDILVRLQPENFNDIIALVALYRPGPLESGMVENYIQGKHGKIEITYELEQLRPILEETYGVILYQEQVMQIASTLADYSLSDADILRRAMGKKKPETMREQRQRFVEGAKKKGIDPRKANSIFDLMEKFAGYGFNKSHSAAYALIAYQTAYLKAHYPVEYMAALLNSVLSNTDQVVKIMNECHDKNIKVLPPDVNASDRDFTIKGNCIRFGLGAVKNVGGAAVDVIIEAREKQGPFRSIFDFCERVDTQKVNRRVIEQLIKCGAFDSIHKDRARVLAALDYALDRAQVIQRDRQSGQLNIFDVFRSARKASSLNLPEVPRWDVRQTLKYEKESLGFYISGHPLDNYEKDLAELNLVNTNQLHEKPEKSKVALAGIVAVDKEITTKKGERMAFLTLEDKHGAIEVVAFPEAYGHVRTSLEEDTPWVIIGSIQHDEKGSKIIAERFMTVEEALAQAIDSIKIYLDAERLSRDDLTRLRRLLANHPGNCPTFLHIRVAQKAEAVIAVGPELTVNPARSFLREVTECFGPNSVERVLRREWIN